MRDINAEELATLSAHYYRIGDKEKAKKYELEFDELQAEFNKD